MIDPANIKLEVHGINVTLNHNCDRQTSPAILLGQRIRHDHTLAIPLPGFDLILRHLEIAEYLEEFIRIGPRSKGQISPAFILINSIEPGIWNHGHHARNRSNLVPVIHGQRKSERHAMPHHQPLRRFPRCRPPTRKRYRTVIMKVSRSREKPMLKTHAKAAALVAKRVLCDEPGQSHARTPGRCGNRGKISGASQLFQNSRQSPRSATGPSWLCSAAKILTRHRNSIPIVAISFMSQKWRSSSGPDDKCHTRISVTVTTAARTRKLRLAKSWPFGPVSAQGFSRATDSKWVVPRAVPRRNVAAVSPAPPAKAPLTLVTRTYTDAAIC